MKSGGRHSAGRGGKQVAWCKGPMDDERGTMQKWRKTVKKRVKWEKKEGKRVEKNCEKGG